MEGDELEEEDDDEDNDIVGGIPTEPNRKLDPLEVHFSQFRCRSTFRDDKLLVDTEALIRAVPITPGGSSSDRGGSAEKDGVSKAAASSAIAAAAEDGVSKAAFRLETPFPPIQVLQWRCKLRDAEGRPRICPKTGGELYDNVDRWFSLDNRRLCCLQKAAVRSWPQRTFVDVIELPAGDTLTKTRTRQLKKFRTFDRGKTILIGGRNEGNTADKWSWREKVGQQDSDADEPDADHAHVQMRRRRRENERGTDRRGRDDPHRRRPGGAKDEEERGGYLPTWATSWGGILMFFFIYLCLRILVKVLHGIYLKMQTAPTT